MYHLGPSRHHQDEHFLQQASNSSSSTTSPPSPLNSNQSGASSSALFRPSVTVSVVPSSVSKPCVSSAAASTSLSTEQGNTGAPNKSMCIAGTSRNRAVSRSSSCGKPNNRPYAEVDEGSSATGEPLIEALIAEPVLGIAPTRSGVEAGSNNLALHSNRSSPSVSIVAGPSVSQAVVPRPIVSEAVVTGPSVLAASLVNEATVGPRSNAVVIELNDRNVISF